VSICIVVDVLTVPVASLAVLEVSSGVLVELPVAVAMVLPALGAAVVVSDVNCGDSDVVLLAIGTVIAAASGDEYLVITTSTLIHAHLQFMLHLQLCHPQ